MFKKTCRSNHTNLLDATVIFITSSARNIKWLTINLYFTNVPKGKYYFPKISHPKLFYVTYHSAKNHLPKQLIANLKLSVLQ